MVDPALIQAVGEFLEAIAWPIVVLVVAWWARSIVPALLPRLRGLKYGPFEMSLDPNDMRQLAEKIAEPVRLPTAQAAEPNSFEVRIQAAMRVLEIGIVDVARARGFTGRAEPGARAFLVEHGFLNAAAASQFEELLELSRNVGPGTHRADQEDAETFEQMAARMIHILFAFVAFAAGATLPQPPEWSSYRRR